MTNQHDHEALGRAIRAKSPLTFDDTRNQIPALIAAELAGDNVDISFAAVFKAFDVFPELAEEYYAQMEAQLHELQDEQPLPKPPTIPQFVAIPGPARADRGWNVGKVLSALLTPIAFAKGGTRLVTHEITSQQDTADLIEDTAVVMSEAHQLEVQVSLMPGVEKTWRVSASIANQDLTLIRQEGGTSYFDLAGNPKDSPVDIHFHLITSPI